MLRDPLFCSFFRSINLSVAFHFVEFSKIFFYVSLPKRQVFRSLLQCNAAAPVLLRVGLQVRKPILLALSIFLFHSSREGRKPAGFFGRLFSRPLLSQRLAEKEREAGYVQPDCLFSSYSKSSLKSQTDSRFTVEGSTFTFERTPESRMILD